MAEMLLTIQHDGTVFSPPVLDEIKIEWERSGVPGKLTFTTIRIPDNNTKFGEGDAVCFYYDKKLVFMGYVFTKSRDREQRVKVTCYDQLRYFKNKFCYVFENKTATEIIRALCKDFNLTTGQMDSTNYVIPAIAEENSTAYDIALKVLEDTLTNTGQMYVLYDDAGEITLRNCANMQVGVLIDKDTAENFDYSSSIDDQTYNSIILYYKDEDGKFIPFSASDPEKIERWGTLRYFEEIKIPTLAQNKANQLLELYARKTRELSIKNAFGSTDVRPGCLIPVQLDLGDIRTNNFMLVEKTTHKFTTDHYTMDLTLEGAWED
jgi:hypothetical protein